MEPKVHEEVPPSYIEVTEQKRLNEAREKGAPWKKWGPYLSERQWGTVREDYSQDGNAWDYFSTRRAPPPTAGVKMGWPDCPMIPPSRRGTKRDRFAIPCRNGNRGAVGCDGVTHQHHRGYSSLARARPC